MTRYGNVVAVLQSRHMLIALESQYHVEMWLWSGVVSSFRCSGDVECSTVMQLLLQAIVSLIFSQGMSASQRKAMLVLVI